MKAFVGKTTVLTVVAVMAIAVLAGAQDTRPFPMTPEPCAMQTAEDATKVGRYQMTAVRKEKEEVTVLYMTDTVTGRVWVRTVPGEEWKPILPAVPVSAYDDAVAEHQRKTVAEKELQQKADAERKAINALFRTGTLEEQVKAAESVQVIKCDSGKTGSGSRGLTLSEELKGSRFSKKESPDQNVLSRHGWRALSGHGSKVEVGDVFVCFIVPLHAAPQDTAVDLVFVFASSRVQIPEEPTEDTTRLARMTSPFWRTTSVTISHFVREPTDMIEDIKAILKKKE